MRSLMPGLDCGIDIRSSRIAWISYVIAALVIQTALGAPVTIVHEPQSQSAILFQQAAFGVIAHGTTPITYQWYKNAIPLAGQTKDQIVLKQVRFSDEGAYSVTVANGEGEIRSSNAGLTITLPQAGDVDGTFLTGGTINAAVRTMTLQPDGKFLIGGEFSTVHGAVRGGIARLNHDGTTDHTFLHGLQGASGSVECISVQADGGILVGGSFTMFNGTTRSNLAWLNADGSLRTYFQPEFSGYSCAVLTIARQPDGNLLVGGRFESVNGQPCTNIVRLHSDGTVDSSFNCALVVPGDVVNEIVLQEDGRIVIGGSWNVRFPTGYGIARLNSDGTPDLAFPLVPLVRGNENVGGYPSVTSVLPESDGGFIIAGSFSSVNGIARNCLARLTAAGILDTNFNPALPGLSSAVLGTVRAIISVDANRLIVAGESSHPFICRLGPSGAVDSSFVPLPDERAYTLALQSNGAILLGGAFLEINSLPTTRIARIRADGNLDPTFKPDVTGANGTITAMHLREDGRVLIGGHFRDVNATLRGNVAELNPDGSLNEFAPDIWGYDPWVSSISPHGNGRIAIGGRDMRIASDRSERFVVEKSLVNAIPGSGTTGLLNEGTANWISVLMKQADGKLLVGGAFNSPHPGLVRFDGDTLDGTFQADALSNQTVYALAVQQDGRIFAAGSSLVRLHAPVRPVL